jgi:hypothetical protein
LQVRKSDFGVHLQHASMTPWNMEYTKYDLPSAQNSRDALAKGIFHTLLPFSQNVRVQLIRTDFYNNGGGADEGA